MEPNVEKPGLVRVRFTGEHEDRGVRYSAGQEADVTNESADYIQHVAKSGHRLTSAPVVESEPKGRGASRVTKE